MSETLRDLVVSLSLNSDNFTRNIKSINKQIQEAESAFRLASAGVENFETTTTGLSTKFSTLQRTFQLQQDAVGQYERALQQASDKLQECYARQNGYAQRLVDAKDKQQQLKTEVASAAQAYRHYKNTLGETDSATIAAKANLDAYKGEYRAAVQEVRKLEGQNITLRKSTQNAADAFSAAQTKLNGAKGAVKETAAEIDQCSRQLALSQTSWKSAGEAIQASQRSIASIGKQLKTAESSYRLAAAGVKDFDKSAAGLTAKLTLLQEKLGLQQKAVAEYEKALAAAKEQLQAAQQVNDPDKIREATDAVQDAETALNNACAVVKQTQADIASCNKELKTAQSEWTKAGKSMESFGKACDNVSKNLNKAGKLLSTTLTTPIVALGAAAIKSSIDFESSFASVRKTVDATEAQFEQLAATSKKMSTEVAAGTDEINEVMAAGGQLGVATEHLSDFTRVMVDLGNSCEDLNAGDAATTIAQFANIMGTSQSQFSNIGSTLVDLGNNFATTEKPIMEMAHRMAGAGKQVGLTEAQVLGFAAALSSVGIEAQMGGSAFSKALIKMEVASATGGQALEDFGKVAGMTGQQFKALWDSDPAAAFQSFIVGLSKLDDEGESAIAVLDEIGIKEIRLRDTMLRAVNATDLFSRAQNMATSAWKKNTALSEEANKRYATTESKLKNLKNTALLFGQQIGDDLNPTIRSLIDGAEELLQKFLSMDESQRKQIIQFAAYAAAAGPVLLALGKITKGVGTVSASFGKFATEVGKAGGAQSLGGSWKGFLSILGKSPAVWFAVAAAVVAGTIALADYVSGAKQAREALKGMEETAKQWKDTAAETFYDSSEGLSFFGMSKSDFVRDRQSAQKWLDGLLAVWSDGEKESNEIVAHWTDSFKSLTDSTRTELQALKDTADKSGYTSVSKGLAADIQTLDQMDAEIERLLKKRQNGHLSDKDKIRLQEVTGGADVSGLTPEIAECLVAGYKELASGADVSLLKPDEIVAYVSQYAEQQDVDISALSPEGVTAFVMAYEEATGGALTTALTPDDVTAMVAKYLQAENVDLSALTPDQIEAIVSRYAEATGCDKSQLLPSFTAYITEYKEAEGVSVPKPKTQVIITGYDYLAYRQLQNNPDLTLELPVRLGELPDGELDKLMADGKVKFWKDGVEVPIEAVPDGTIDASTVASLDQDGTLHILITPEITGTKEAIDALSPVVDETDKLGVTMAGMRAGIRPTTTMDMVDSALGRIQSYQETLDYNWWNKFWASVFGASTNLGVLDQSMKSDFNPETVAEMSAYVAEVVSAIQQGEQVPKEDLENLQAIVEFLNGLDVTDTGAHIREGIAHGMTEAGFDSDAETVAANLETALNTALQIESPSKRVKPTGEYVAAGVGEGMSSYDFSADAQGMASNIDSTLQTSMMGESLKKAGTAAAQGLSNAMTSYPMAGTGRSLTANVRSAVQSSLNRNTLRSAGVNAMAGLRAGILAGRSGVISAMRSAAREAVNAAKKELKIKSPSQVFRDEVGVMTMRGFGAGVLKESKEQAKVIRNASRFLTGEAREGAIVQSSSDNRRTYNNNVSSTIQVQQMVVRDEQDIRSLAVEIATLTRRQQRGKGLRMA